MSTGPYIQTRSGEHLFLQSPDPWKITLEDIAHALSNLCRFTGHTSTFYSVAQHSVMVAHMVQDAGCNLATQRAALMHDAAEAFLGDVSSPLKSLLPEYKELEDIWWRAVAHRFALLPELPRTVKLFDARAVVAEAYAFLGEGPTGPGWPDVDVDPSAPALTPWAPRQAFEAFMKEAARVDVA